MDNNFPFPQYIEPILQILIENQQSIYQMLSLTDKSYPKAIKELSLLMNNILSENVFSIEQFSDQYIIILTRLIIDEVQKLTSKNDINSFLKEKTVLNRLFSTLFMRQDIIEYFREILHFPLTYIDYIEKDELFIFNIQTLHEILLTKEEEQTEQGENNSTSRRRYKQSFWKKSFDKKENKEEPLSNKTQKNQKTIKINNLRNKSGKIDLNQEAQSKLHMYISLKFPNIDLNKISNLNEITFHENYIPDITVSDIDGLISKENDESMKQYLTSIRKLYETNPTKYSNTPMITQIYNYEKRMDIFELYRRYFCIVIQLIEEIIIHLEYDFGKLPDILRYICKIIEMTLCLKFPDIQEYELIPFLGKFLFEKVMFPILTYPIYFGLTDSTILSSKSTQNIITLIKIISKFYSGELFESDKNSYLTLFNKFFITKMDILLHFFHKISTTTQIPHILEKFIFPQKYNFDPNTYIHKPYSHKHEMFCIYSIKQIIKLYEVLQDNIDYMFKDIDSVKKNRIIKCFDKLKEHYDDIKSMITSAKEQKTKQLKIFHIVYKTDLFLKMENFLEGDIHYNKGTINKKDPILKAKKGFCSCLNNIMPLSQYQTELLLNSEDYNNITLSDALETLASNIICDYNTFKWDLEKLKSLLDTLPIEYKENNHSLFMKEITSEINESLKDVKAYFSIIGSFNDDITYLNNELSRADEIFFYLKKEMITKAVINFVKNAKIPIKFGFEKKLFKTTNKTMYIQPIKSIGKIQEGICETIQNFIDEFPDIKQIDGDKNHFLKMQELNIFSLLKTYFQLIKDEITNNYENMKLYTLELFFTNNPQSPYCDSNINELNISNEPTNENDKFSELNDSYEKSEDQSNQLHPIINNNKQIDDAIKSITINQIFEQIVDYFIGSLYDKLFPTEQTNEDILFVEQCSTLEKQSLIEFESTAVIDCNDCIVQCVECIYRFEKTNSPLEKGYQLNQIFHIIKTKLTYIKKGTITLDDMFPYILFSFIKAKPLKFITNLDYIDKFKIPKYDYAITSVRAILNQFKNTKKEDSNETIDTTCNSQQGMKYN